jgi:hypothetical protein
MSAVAVTGHSTTNRPNGRFTFDTGYSAMGVGGQAVYDRLHPRRPGTPDPELSAVSAKCWPQTRLQLQLTSPY